MTQGCSGKGKYGSISAAKTYIQYSREKWGLRLFFYKCTDCSFYHLTKADQYKWKREQWRKRERVSSG